MAGITGGGDNNPNDDRLVRYLTGLSLLGQVAQGGAESQIHTQDPISIKTRFTLQVLHWLGVFVAVLGSVGGLFLFTIGIDWLLRLGWDARFYLAIWIVVLVVIAGIVAGVEAIMDKLGMDDVPLLRAFAIVGALLFVGLAVFSLLLSTRERFGWQLVGMIVGAALLLSSPAFGYNQLQELVFPYWRRSPYEQAVIKQVLPTLANLLPGDNATPASVIVEDPRLMHRHYIAARPKEVVDPAEQNWQEFTDSDEQMLVTMTPEAGNLIWFVLFASRLNSLAISELTIKPAPKLPFPEAGDDGQYKARSLRRDMIRRLIARGSTEREIMVDRHKEHGMGDGGYWRLRGQGIEPEWVMDKAQAVERVLLEWRSVYGDEIPPPFYWPENRVSARRAA